MFEIPFVKLSEATIEDQKRGVVHVRQTGEKPIVLTEIKISVQDRAIGFDERIELQRAFALGSRFLQYAGEAISVAQFPMYGRVVVVGFERIAEQRHSLL